MASYTYVHNAFYNDSTGAYVTDSASSFTIDDDGAGASGVGNGNDEFELGETVFNGFGTYLGTATVGGITGPAFQLTGQIGIYLPASPITAVEATLPTINPVSLPFCFLAGTEIMTPQGAKPVECLGIGDDVNTHDGKTVPVKWIGYQTVFTRFGPADRLMPVRVRAGALGGGLPVRDLTLTADHALLVDGLLINAGALVNGDDIDRVPLSELGESFTVYHVETENHDVILAEGAPAETFIDYVGRQSFDNYAEFTALYGEDRTIPEMAYPRISSARLLPPALRQRFRKTVAA